VVCFRGGDDAPQGGVVVEGLHFNTLYHFSLRVFTARSVSPWSRPLDVLTAPGQLSRPVLVGANVHGRVALKWYPEAHGAAKFVVEGELVEALDARADRLLAAQASSLQKQGWRVLYAGKDSAARLAVAATLTAAAAAGGGGGGGDSAQLLPHAVYRVRVTALNAADACGPPSEPTLLRTPPAAVGPAAGSSKLGPGGPPGAGSRAHVLRPANAHELFTVECRGDVVVGDTIVCTEQLFVGRDGKLVKGGGGGGPHHSLRASASALEKDTKVYLGERTLAAFVVRDTYRVAHRELGPPPGHRPPSTAPRGRLPSRTLRLEVAWCTVSSDAAGSFVLGRGELVERDEAALSSFEVFRMEWAEEGRRRCERDERELCRRLAY
jgi:hypothetical protein